MKFLQLTATLLVSTCLAALSCEAFAQEPPKPNVTVRERARPEYDPLGIRAGMFMIYPSLTVGSEYDSNVFASENDEEDDLGLLVSPRVNVQSLWSRHALSLTAGGQAAFYEEFDDNNYFDFDLGAQSRIDITRANAIRAGLSFARDHEDRASPDQGGADDVTKFYTTSANLGYRHEFNRLFLQVDGRVLRSDFLDDPGGINNDDRDRNRYSARLRGGYAISPRIRLFGEGEYRIVRYDTTPDDGGVDRDSDGFALRAGAEVDITGLLFGEVAIGYTRQDYDDPALDTAQGVNAVGQLTWNPTPLTSVVGSVELDVKETTVAGASGNFQKSFTIDVTHELLRNLLLDANLGFTRDDFEGTDRSDNTFAVGGGVSWLLNRNVAVDATYSFATRDSDIANADYTRHIVRVGVTGRL
ncbi:hypothetical protein HRbin40_00122 [bacterium HR40]|nr:hypothetical protein HRbin40_00122 [bacterium HR40]